MTMGDLCARLRNYFSQPGDRHPGTYTAEGGQLSPVSFLSPGQYYRIIGSRFCDGVYRYGTDTLPANEVFDGCVWAMRVPPAVVSMLGEINMWLEKYGAAAESPYSFESFGGYSYSKPARKTDPAEQDTYGWWGTFSSRLSPWRRQQL